MSAAPTPEGQVAPDARVVASGEGLAARRAIRDARIRGIALAVLGVLAFSISSSNMDAPADFSFWIDRQGGEDALISTTVGLLWIIAGLGTGIVAALQLLRGALFRWRPWLIVLVALWIPALLGSLLAGRAANLSGAVSGSLELATPLALGAMAGILSERSGMFNIALEGKMLAGACVSAIAASVMMLWTGNGALAIIVGILVAMLTAALLGLLLAWLGIRHRVDQIIAGTVINIGVIGITSFLFLRVLGRFTELNNPPTVASLELPVLSSIPVIGPMFFASRPYVYLTWILVAVLAYMLFKTRWGLRLRASGEKPAAAGTVGINVIRIRYQALLLAGLICGFAGSYLSLATSGSFQMEMTAGKGFIALAAVIFGAWHPIGAFFAALVFGFADASQTLLSVMGVQVPPQLLNSIPYVVTIVVVAGVVGRVRGPAAAGQPYEQG
jgi:general nucleoside transport system permease protein